MAGLEKPVRRRDPKYLDWIRRQPCIITGKASDLVDAHHVSVKGHGGMGTKPDDRRALPLSRGYHIVYHDIGRAAFELRFGVDLEALIVEHNRKYPAGRSQKLSIGKKLTYPSVVAMRLKCPCGCIHTFPVTKITLKNTPGGVSFSYHCPAQNKPQQALRRTA